MNIQAILTKRVEVGDDLYEVLKQSLPEGIQERSVLCISSKLVALCEGSVVLKRDVEKDELVIQEADYYLPRSFTPGSHVIHTVVDGVVMASSGVDASNSGDHYVLLPRDSYQSAKDVWQWVKEEYGVTDFGVVITDSRSLPFKRGVVGVSTGYYGFNALKDYRGSEDLFGREMEMSRVNVPDSLASSAVFAMGEGSESTPLALITKVESIDFSIYEPHKEFHVPMQEDVYGPFYLSAPWKRGGRNTKS